MCNFLRRLKKIILGVKIVSLKKTQYYTLNCKKLLRHDAMIAKRWQKEFASIHNIIYTHR